ncbi:putative DNA polymerase iota [Aspergillus chevalieri]|uniref:UmuC domain-containing protein n=1 Tax=Aspergillus chevalieri TaxID=182096 RepID=A0A7R7VEQ0_ASPCH|nr:uncharacterized protein ACHE_10842S [Aspergillus chevalieri]BCR83440.1 hypothetical protein ACHE_10842S [Aspergillus chevalieri]
MANRDGNGRVILHLDYDCFYAAVFEVDQPALKSRPLAVQQKQIIVTCNYEARRRGLYKLQRIQDARQVCPDAVIVLGEDLTQFRDVSKELFLYLRSLIWGDRVERLGFDELFLDVTDMIDYNIDLLNTNNLEHSFFHLDRQDPTVGFIYNATEFYGPTWPPVDQQPTNSPETRGYFLAPKSDLLCMRLLVASHLAGYLRQQLESHKGYTATVGISTNKLLAKLAGKVHKPKSQTTLLPPYGVDEGPDVTIDSNVIRFMNGHEIRKIPGIGSKIAHKLHDHMSRSMDNPLTVRELRLLPGMGPGLLNRIVGGPGYSKGMGARVWGLIHGIDNSEVLEARDVPTQISIEDSYGRLDRFEIVKNELVKLTVSLLRRMRIDLTEEDSAGGAIRWRAHPRTLRLTSRPRRPSNPDNPYHNRMSRSVALPQYVFNMGDRVEAVAERLVQEHVLALFRRLHPEKSGWNLSLLNIAVTNMVDIAGDKKQNSGRDIGSMFQKQGSVRIPAEDVTIHADEPTWEESDEDEAMPSVPCRVCGEMIPCLAVEAHEVYHQAPD